MTALLHFQPTRLQGAVRDAVRLHPRTAAAAGAGDESVLRELRRRVAAVSGDAGALDSLARQLSPRDVRALITGLRIWEHLRPAVAALLTARMKASHLPMLWVAWQRSPLIREYAQVMARLPVEAWGFLPNPYSRLAPEWIQSSDPGVALQEWLDGQSLTHSDLAQLAGARFMPDTPLLRLVHEAVLTHGSAAQLRKEKEQLLLRVARELALDGKRMLFGRNYLSQFEVPEWSLPVLEQIREWYGLPRRPRLTRFWEPVPERIRIAFQRIFLQRTIDRAFGDDERSRYWIRWVDALDDVHEGNAGVTRYAVLLFPTFGVVEFFEIGNAAYFYRRAQAELFAGRRAYAPSDLKEIQHPGIGWFGDNRLIHNQGWQRKADSMVAAYARLSGGH